MYKAHSPTSHRVALRHAIDHDRLIVEACWRDKLVVVHERAIDLVRHQPDVPFFGEFRQVSQFVCGRRHTGRIRWAVAENQLRLGGDGVGNTIDIDAEFGIRIDQDWLAAGQSHKRCVHHEVGIEDNHFIAWVHQREHR